MTFLRSRANRIRTLALLALAAGTLCACAPEPVPTPTPTAAFATEEEAFAAAEEVYRAYITTFNKIDLQDPTTFEGLSEFTTGDYLSSERESLSQMHANGQIRGGEIIVVTFQGTEYSAAGAVLTTTCNDVSGTTFTDENGNSLVPEDRPDRYALLLTFNLADSSLRLEKAVSTSDATC
ncbi:hypothetical protein [Microbacterium sp. A84]|uniref:hypothetical protein n=1 Tax=Microbacterium sp. A84 TaxID=3450715 RepID=UPI003F439B46